MSYTADEAKEWEKEFEAAARRSLRERMRYAFVHTHKPVLDDVPCRAFDTTAQYRQWYKNRESLPRLEAFREYLRKHDLIALPNEI